MAFEKHTIVGVPSGLGRWVPSGLSRWGSPGGLGCWVEDIYRPYLSGVRYPQIKEFLEIPVGVLTHRGYLVGNETEY